MKDSIQDISIYFQINFGQIKHIKRLPKLCEMHEELFQEDHHE